MNILSGIYILDPTRYLVGLLIMQAVPMQPGANYLCNKLFMCRRQVSNVISYSFYFINNHGKIIKC